jgi:hypothetical protein
MRILFFISCLLFFCSDLNAGQYDCDDNKIDLTIKKLGYEIDSESFRREMKLLSENPSNAVSCLIKELHTVNEKEILSIDKHQHKSALHVVWCLRALRYLTGIDFTGKTTYKFKNMEKNREYFLTKNSKTELPFFTVWMSRDTLYIAPKDTQKEIINKWAEWYKVNGGIFKYKPMDDINKWYF